MRYFTLNFFNTSTLYIIEIERNYIITQDGAITDPRQTNTGHDKP